MSFNGLVVLITGASSGIGAGAAYHFASLGANVVIVGRNKTRLNEVADQIKKNGSSTPLVIAADVTKDAQRIVDETIKHFKKLDVLVNNAGVCAFDTIDSMTRTEYERMFETNVWSVINLTKLCVPHLEKTKGNVVNVSSVCGIKPLKNLSTYCMAKAALDLFTKCSALDLAPKGIRVNSVNPAMVRTPLFQLMGMPKNASEAMFESKKAEFPVGRVGEVTDIAAAMAYLANNKTAAFVTGHLLVLDGGSMLL